MGFWPRRTGPISRPKWKAGPPTTWEDCRLGGIGGIPKPCYFDLGPYTYDWLPTVGGSGFGLDRLGWTIPSVRLKQPNQDVREFHGEIAKRKKRMARKRTPQNLPNDEDLARLKSEKPPRNFTRK